MERRCGNAHEEDDCHQSGEGDHHPRELEEQKIAIVEEGGISLGAEERGSKGIPIVTRRAVEKMVVRPGTCSPERREPLR